MLATASQVYTQGALYFLRQARLLHDYVADRVAYDIPNYLAGSYPPSDHEIVFRSRLAVCAGYAKSSAPRGSRR